MIVDISCLTKGGSIPVALTKSVGVSPEFRLLETDVQVELRGTLSKALDFYFFDGVLEANLNLGCDKCLGDLTYPISVPVHERFVKAGDWKESANGLEDDSDQFDEVWTFTETTIDFTELVESVLFLNIPYRVLCKEDCKGLCVQCGKNLNDSDCPCEDSGLQVHNKFEALRSLFNE